MGNDDKLTAPVTAAPIAEPPSGQLVFPVMAAPGVILNVSQPSPSQPSPITAAHVDKAMELADARSIREHERAMARDASRARAKAHDKGYTLAGLVVVLTFSGLMARANHPELVKDILLGGLGLVGGYGVGRARGKDSEEK